MTPDTMAQKPDNAYYWVSVPGNSAWPTYYIRNVAEGFMLVNSNPTQYLNPSLGYQIQKDLAPLPSQADRNPDHVADAGKMVQPEVMSAELFFTDLLDKREIYYHSGVTITHEAILKLEQRDEAIRAHAIDECTKVCNLMERTSPRKPFQEAAAWLAERISNLKSKGAGDE